MTDIVAPPGFDQLFFNWLGEMSEALYVQFASAGSVPEPDIAQLEQKIGGPLPADVRRFYARYNPWGVLTDWFGWESITWTLTEALGATAQLVPIDCRSYSSQGRDTVAVIHGPEQYEVVERWRATGAVRRYPDLRSFFIAGVAEESDNDQERG